MKNGLKNKKRFSSTGLLFIVLLLLSSTVLIYRYHVSYSVPGFKNIIFKVNGNYQSIENNGVITLHPHDIVFIEKINTTGVFPSDIPLVCESIDVEAMQEEPLLLSGLLPGNEIFNHYLFGVQVYCRDSKIGSFNIAVQPYVEDWLQRAGKIINPDSRVVFLEKAASVVPNSREISRELLSAYMHAGMNDKTIEMLESEWNKSGEQDILVKLWEQYKVTDNVDGQISVAGRFIEKGWDSNNLWLAEQAAIFEKTGNIPKAVKCYEKLIAGLEGKERIPVAEHIAFISAENNAFDDAVKYYLEAVKLGSGDPNIFYNLAAVYDRQGKFKEAGEALARAVSANPADIPNRLRFASEAVESKKWEDALRWTNEILLIQPELKDALMLKAEALDAVGNGKELDAVYEKLLKIEPANQTVLFNRAVLALESDNPVLSLKLFEKYLEIIPEDKDARAFVFDILCREGRLEDAVSEARKLSSLLPGEPVFFSAIGNLLVKAENHVLLLNTMEEALLLFPDNNEMKNLLLFAAVEIDDSKKLLGVIERLLKDSPEDKNLLELRFFICRKEGLNSEAVDTALKIIETGAGKKEMFHFLFEFFNSVPDYQKISSLMEQAVVQFPDEISFREYLVSALVQLSRYDDAIKVFEEIIDLSPENINRLLNLAMLLEKTGRIEDSKKIYARILSVDPENRIAEEAYLRLSIELIQ